MKMIFMIMNLNKKINKLINYNKVNNNKMIK